MDSNPEVEIKIFGSHCRRCEIFKKVVSQIVDELQINARIDCLGNPEDFLRFNVFYLPALAINGKLLFQGGFPSTKKLKKIIETELINLTKE